MRKLLIVDYNGVLTLYLDPVDVLLRMRHKGWAIVLWAGGYPDIIESYHPGILAAIDQFVDKLVMPEDFVPPFGPLSEVLLCDDHRFIVGSTLNWAAHTRKEPWTAITPEGLREIANA